MTHSTQRELLPSAWIVSWKDRGMDCSRVFQIEADALNYGARDIPANCQGKIEPLYRATPQPASPTTEFDATKDNVIEYQASASPEVMERIISNRQPAAPMPDAVKRDIQQLRAYLTAQTVLHGPRPETVLDEIISALATQPAADSHAGLRDALVASRSFVEATYQNEGGEEAVDAKHVLDQIDAALSSKTADSHAGGDMRSALQVLLDGANDLMQYTSCTTDKFEDAKKIAEKVIASAQSTDVQPADAQSPAAIRDDWQPIETMPACDEKNKDEEVIVTGGHLGRGVELRLIDGDWFRHATKAGYTRLPTYWMRIPPTPQQAVKPEGK